VVCYRDMTFCDFYRECAEQDCPEALTEMVKEKAQEIGLPISHFLEKPDCFKEALK